MVFQITRVTESTFESAYIGEKIIPFAEAFNIVKSADVQQQPSTENETQSINSNSTDPKTLNEMTPLLRKTAPTSTDQSTFIPPITETDLMEDWLSYLNKYN